MGSGPGLTMDEFDQRIEELERGFTASISSIFTDAEAAIDFDELVAAIETGDEEAIATALHLDEGLQTDLDHHMNGVLFYGLLGAIVIAMLAFAREHGSRAVPTAETEQIRAQMRRNIFDPLARKAHDATLLTIRILRDANMDARTTAQAAIRSISLSPDQARSLAYLRRALTEALTHSDAVERDGAVTLPAPAIQAIARRAANLLNAGQRSALSKVLHGPINTHVVEDVVARHTRALRKFRQGVMARQEAMRAIHTGEYLAFRQGRANRSIPKNMRRFWQTRGDERVRHDHRLVSDMNPNGVDVGEAFQTPLGPVLFPPLEINCRCRAVVRRAVAIDAVEPLRTAA